MAAEGGAPPVSKETIRENPMQFEQSSPELDIPAIYQAYREAFASLSYYQQIQLRNYETRQMIWPGQSDDCRKHARAPDNPFPWDGASDLRVPVVDEIINMMVAQYMVALKKASVRAVPVNANDVARASVVSQFLRWLVLSQMEEINDMAELLANYVCERGVGVVGVFWEERQAKVQQTIRLSDLNKQFKGLGDALVKDEYKEELADMMAKVTGVSKPKAKRMLKELKNTGETTFPKVLKAVNRPFIRVYAVGDDLVVPANIISEQEVPFIFRRQYYTQDQLRDKVNTEGWDPDFVEAVIAKGPTFTSSDFLTATLTTQRFGNTGLSAINFNKYLYEVVHAYRRLVDEDRVPGIWVTVMAPTLGLAEKNGGENSAPLNIIGKHYLLDYGSGMYPFVFFQYERTSRFLLETRGVSNIARCWQDSIKVEMDSRIDAASMATLPPITHPPGRPPTLWGPGQFIETRRPGDYNYAPPPPPPEESVEVQNRLETMAYRYFGRDIGPDYQVEGTLKVQKGINRWLEGWGKVIKMIWGLYQQFGDDAVFFRVSGQPTSKPIQFQKGSPTDQYDIYISYNYENSDPEAFLNKLEKAVQLAGQLDRNGMVEWNKLLIAAFQTIDITFVDDFLQPADSAANKEVNDAQLTYAKAAAGFDVDVPQTASTQIWQQVLQQYLQGSPNLPATDVQARYQSDPAFRGRIDKLSKQLQFKMEQMQNAQIGRIGTPPAPGPAPQLQAVS